MSHTKPSKLEELKDKLADDIAYAKQIKFEKNTGGRLRTSVVQQYKLNARAKIDHLIKQAEEQAELRGQIKEARLIHNRRKRNVHRFSNKYFVFKIRRLEDRLAELDRINGGKDG